MNSPETVNLDLIKDKDRKEKISKYGFAITSHALHRYRLRIDEHTTMDMLYKKLANTDIKAYLNIKRSGIFNFQDNLVAVIKDKLILTFKDMEVMK